MDLLVVLTDGRCLVSFTVVLCVDYGRGPSWIFTSPGGRVVVTGQILVCRSKISHAWSDPLEFVIVVVLQ